MRSAPVVCAILSVVWLGVLPVSAADESRAPDVVAARLATDVVQSRNAESLAGDFVVVVPSTLYSRVRKDGDLGPFVEAAISNGDDSVVVIVPYNMREGRALRAVFFGGPLPRAWSEFSSSTAPGSGHATATNRQTLTPPFPKGREELFFERVQLTVDDGMQVDALRVLSGGARSAIDKAAETDDAGVEPYARARDLYAEGPSRAPEIIRLLRKQLEKDPKHEEAIRLLATTYFGVGEFEKALEQFDAGIAIAGERGTIVPVLVFYRAKTLFALGRCVEARLVLESHWAFWQDGGYLQKEYDRLYPAVLAKCPKEEKDSKK